MTTTPAELQALHLLLEQRNREEPEAVFIRFLADGEDDERVLRVGDLAESARRIAGALQRMGLDGRPVLLAEAPGPAFIEGLFGCWWAGAIAVPVHPPAGGLHRRRFEAVAADSGARHAFLARGVNCPPGITRLDTAGLADAGETVRPRVGGDGPCLLQYTSGSTASPKGVMISHANLRAHHAALSIYRPLGIRSILSWLPPYHDMGLVLKLLHAFQEGIPIVWMSPGHFIQRPARWLHAISRHRAEMSGGPNFAFEAVLRSIRDADLDGLDLSCWKAAPCGAERVRADTLDRFSRRFAAHGFRKEAFLPGYGLAESTLIVTAHSADTGFETTIHPQAGRHVSCGRPVSGVEIRICDPDHGTPLTDGRIGEIRVRGPMVADGYWNRSDETRETFPDGGAGLKTGDLGFLDRGRLFVTGRIRDLIIADGVNIAPEDIEAAVIEAMSDVPAAAAFAVDDGRSEQVLLVIEAARSTDHWKLTRRARSAVAERIGIALARCLVVRPGLIPRTTSGKIRRHACRIAWESGRLAADFDDAAVSQSSAQDHATVKLLVDCACDVSGRQRIAASDGWRTLGLGSLEAARFAGRVEERLGVRLPIGRILAAGSFDDLAESLHDLKPSRVFDGVIPVPGSITHSQERMWFLREFDPSSPAYHVFGAVELSGPLDAATLGRAFDAVVARHGMLRSRHGVRGDRPAAWITSEAPPVLITTAAASLHDARALLEKFARQTFELADEAPVRARLVRISADSHVLGISAHHIAMDGWSLRILSRELARAYRMLRNGDSVRFEAPAPDFPDYAARHRSWIDGGAVNPQIAFWKRAVDGHPGVIPLPADHPRPARPAFEGGFVQSAMTAELCDLVDRAAIRHHATPFMIHLAVFLLLLQRHGAGDDLITAIPVANRHLAGAGDLVGTLVNTLPFRLRIEPEEPFSLLLERVRSASIEMQEHQDAPFERIIEAVSPSRTGDHAPLAQVMFDYQEIPVAGEWPDEIACTPFPCHRGGSQFELSLLLTVFGGHRQIGIEFRKDLFRDTTIRLWLDRYLHILRRACVGPDESVRGLADLTEDDRMQLDHVTFGPHRPEFDANTTPEMIARRVAMQPERPAVRDRAGSITFRELDERARCVAAALRGLGIGSGDRVAVLLERDRDLPAVLLGVWLSGAAYVPLDPSNPPARIAVILDDVRPVTLVASPELADRLPPGIGFIPPAALAGTPGPPAETIMLPPTSPAYVIHTSGSTGRPKGVVVSHGALANFLRSMAETPGFTGADHLLAVTTVSFDISLLELFLPLTCGGTVTIIPTIEAGDGLALARAIEESGATVIQATPATWRILLESGWRGSSSLKVLCGGEAMDPRLARELTAHGAQLWNLYGPTETTVWSAVWRVPAGVSQIRIGGPIANTGLHVLLADGSPAPPGVPGTLWVSGLGLADGYWNNPDLTQQRFVTITDHRGQHRLAYDTGDIARWREDGALECLGRADDQVKIRGFRVELGEIEAALASHPAVAQSRVALRRGSAGRDDRLVAWFTSKAGIGTPEPADLRLHLAALLPAHMIPSGITPIGSFPLGPSGKVDVSQLDEPACTPGRFTPIGGTEGRLIEIWSELLEQPSIQPTDNWFFSGGHSLLALRLFGRIHSEFGRRLPLASIIGHPTPRELAALIDRTPRDVPS